MNDGIASAASLREGQIGERYDSGIHGGPVEIDGGVPTPRDGVPITKNLESRAFPGV
ncbi:hypothetical protein [Cupriavidus pampae]|uniref:Uncharacterized protein n=1 Tax=Cupriavidus pampae TaxID=659251 RepID=A0ABN7YS84_9BURK|nr:hypothetical protein [Cupriavidus pampae]CAG9175105.1 hypothetical protein LMG32289_03225 [Cupriavidus pampae]